MFSTKKCIRRDPRRCGRYYTVTRQMFREFYDFLVEIDKLMIQTDYCFGAFLLIGLFINFTSSRMRQPNGQVGTGRKRNFSFPSPKGTFFSIARKIVMKQ